MGLRDRLKSGLKRALGASTEEPRPAARTDTSSRVSHVSPPPAPPRAEDARPATLAVVPAPPVAEPVVARVAEEPVTAAPVTPAPVTPAPVTEAPVTAAPVTPAAVTPPPVTPATPPPPAAPAPAIASPLPKNILSDNDAPLRDAHLRGTFTTTDASFTVRLVNEAEGLDLTIPCEPGEFVLEACDRAGHELPSSCRTGGCLTCAGKVVSGDTDMEEQYTLEDEHIAQGFRLLCCTRVTSDAVFVTHQQEEIH